MADRFDNVPLDDFLTREADARAEALALAETIKRRLVAECPVKVGCVYRFGAQALPWRVGREFLVCSVRADNSGIFRGAARYAAGIHGYNALKSSSAVDGFGIKPHVLQDWRLLWRGRPALHGDADQAVPQDRRCAMCWYRGRSTEMVGMAVVLHLRLERWPACGVDAAY